VKVDNECGYTFWDHAKAIGEGPFVAADGAFRNSVAYAEPTVGGKLGGAAWGAVDSVFSFLAGILATPLTAREENGLGYRCVSYNAKVNHVAGLNPDGSIRNSGWNRPTP
jgi:hypothetical protein